MIVLGSRNEKPTTDADLCDESPKSQRLEYWLCWHNSLYNRCYSMEVHSCPYIQICAAFRYHATPSWQNNNDRKGNEDTVLVFTFTNTTTLKNEIVKPYSQHPWSR